MVLYIGYIMAARSIVVYKFMFPVTNLLLIT